MPYQTYKIDAIIRAIKGFKDPQYTNISKKLHKH